MTSRGFLALSLSALAAAAAAAAVAHATDDIHTPEGAVQLTDKMQACLKQKPQSVECQKYGPTACSSISDDFCKELWAPKNKGNITLPDGNQILSGLSPKSSMSYAEKLDIQALLDSESRLPADYREKVAPVLAKLRETMANENPSTRWSREVGELLVKINDIRDEVSEDRAEAEHPELKGIRPENLRLAQRMIYRDVSLKLQTEVLHAKYENSPNWKRVEDLFSVVKNDLLDSISHFKVSDAEKQRMLDKVKAIKLAMPDGDPRIYGNDADCSHSEVNAAYMDNINTFSICAGYFNTFQDPAAIYFVMAHELSHSIDPVTSAVERFQKTPGGEAVAKFCNAKGPAVSCDEWDKMKRDVFGGVKTIAEAEYPLKKLSSCLKSRQGLRPWSNGVVHEVAFEESTGAMDEVAEHSGFSAVSEPLTLTRDGQTKPNDYYMRPDLFRAVQNANVTPTGTCEGLNGVELFTQSLSCQKLDGKAVDFSKLSQEQRDPLFSKALEETQGIERTMNEQWFSVCGRDCPDLVQAHLSNNTQEDFADWLAHKAFERFIGRQDSQAEKRQTVATAGVLFCDAPSPYALAPDLTAIEKKYDFEVHPDDRIRRMSFFTPQVISQVACGVDASTREGTGSCEL